jgi:glycosyltransferase involved in cell wall biosynthesis
MSDIHKMKLLILATCYPRGEKELREGMVYGKFIKDFAKEWVRRGHEVYVLTPHSINTLSYEKLEGVHVHRFHYFFREPWETLTYNDGVPENIRKFKNKLLIPFLAFGFWRHALKLIREYKIDIVNAHWVPTGYIALWIKAFSKVKLVTTIYGAELFPVIAGRMKILKPFIKKALGKTDIAVGISHATVNAAKELSGREDIYVIPDGIDIDYYKPGPTNVKLLERYNCNGKKIVFYSGRMVERKGHRHLLEAMKYIKKELPDVKLILGGKGPLFQELQNLRLSKCPDLSRKTKSFHYFNLQICLFYLLVLTKMETPKDQQPQLLRLWLAELRQLLAMLGETLGPLQRGKGRITVNLPILMT